MVEITAAAALSLALCDEMAADDSVICLGVGVSDAAGIFGTTKEAHERFPDRVWECPMSENMLTGAIIGMSLSGLKPVLVHARMDFLPLTMEHLVNGAAKGFPIRQMPNVTIRCIVGRGWGQGPTHSQALHAWPAHVPGLRLFIPYRPEDAYLALRLAIRTPAPVLMVESRRLHGIQGSVRQMESLYWGCGRVCNLNSGLLHPKVTIVAIGDCLLDVEAAVRDTEIPAIIVDPQAWPPNWSFITDAVKLTGKLIVVDNGWSSCGLSAEIVARCAEAQVLTAPPIRLTPPPFACPTSRVLEEAWYPGPRDILLAYGKLTGEIHFWPNDTNAMPFRFGGPF